MLYIHIKKGEIWRYFPLYDAEINLPPLSHINPTPPPTLQNTILPHFMLYFIFLLPININHHKGLMFSSILWQNDRKSNALLRFETSSLPSYSTSGNIGHGFISSFSTTEDCVLFQLLCFRCTFTVFSRTLLPFGALLSPYSSVEMPWQHCGADFILRDHKLNSRNTLYRRLFSAMQIHFARG